MFLLLAIAAIIVLVYYYIKQIMTHWEKAGVPSIKPIFLIGNLKEVSQKRHLSEVLFDFYKEFKGKGPFGGIFFFTKPVAILTDLDFIKKVLVKDFSNFSDRGAYFNEKDDPLSAHLFSIEGAKWKNLREKMTPTFTSGKMKMMFPTIVDVGNNFVDTLNREALSGKVEIKELLARFTTDTIGSCAFGIDCDSLKNPQAEFRTMGRKIFDRSAFIILKRFCIVMSKKFANFVGITTTHPEVAKFFLNVVKETIQYREENNVTRKDFLQLMMQIKNHGEIEGESSTNIKTGLITVNEIAAQAFIMYLAGFETSSTAMTFCLYELALNQKLQEKARESIKTVLAKHDGKLTYEANLEMKYIDQCINESLRKYPPVTNLVRTVNNDYKVEGTNWTLKKEHTVWIPVSAIQHDPEYYPDPEIYDPDRFLPEISAKRNPFTFLAFGDGPRVCIGVRFGMMQARIGLISVLSNFKIELAEGSEVPLKISKSDFILTPENGVWLKLCKI